MNFILTAWFAVVAVFLAVPGSYFLYMRRHSLRNWNLQINRDFSPSAAVLVPVYNEEKTICLKLENLANVTYPSGKMEVVIVNDCSSDHTLEEVNRYIQDNPSQNIRIFDSNYHLGKTSCLNNALKDVKADVVIISDADCFWPQDILLKALPYLSDPTVGAITARELLLNPDDTWVTSSEQFYDSTIQCVRIGESKLYSTLFFSGGFAAYKRGILDDFNATDDSGTALDIIQDHKRALLIPEAGFYTVTPKIWRNKVLVKTRRASQLQGLWARCLKLLFKGKLAMPKRIAIWESLLHIFNPLLLVPIAVLSILLLFSNPLPVAALALIFLGTLIFKTTRTKSLEFLQNNLILLSALTFFVTHEKFKFWKPVQESRFLLTRKMLKEKKLI